MDPNSMSIEPSLLPCTPAVVPPLDPGFKPLALAYRDFTAAAAACPHPLRVTLALEQPGGAVSRHSLLLFPPDDPRALANFTLLERVVKTLLWTRGGWRLHLDAPEDLVARLRNHYEASPAGRFDAETVARRIFDHPLELVATHSPPPERAAPIRVGRHTEGCRIGFDLGGSDRKVAAVVHGQVVFSEETPWDPCVQTDPRYHFEGIMDSLQSAAKRLPRVDAIGGSAAGVYVNNQVKVASLFRSVPPDLFEARVRNLFLEIQQAWGNLPFIVMNDGEVAALAGSMILDQTAVLGLAMGTSTAGGWVNSDGNLTSWINELAFVPMDLQANAPRDEWSGDRGVAASYLSQQAVGRLLEPAGIALPARLSLPEKLQHVQDLMAQGDDRARSIYQTIGTYLGYQLAYLAEFYPARHVLLLGRVTTGPGGRVLLAQARHVLETEFPHLANRLSLHLPDERFKRHGQAIAAASLPETTTQPATT
ncbi:ROK family protein [Limisphaera sp. 4302-co]